MAQPFWIPDSRNLLVRAVDASGNISTPAITCTDPLFLDNGSFNDPWAMAGDTQGHVFLVDESAHSQVYMIDLNTLVMTRVAGKHLAFGGAGALGFDFGGPLYTIACDSQGNVYVSDAQEIYCINMQSTSQTILGVGIAAGDIAIVVGGGAVGYSGDGGPATSAQVNGPYGIGIDASDNLYFCDQGNNVVRKVDTSGTISTVVGIGSSAYSGDGGAATAAELNQPIGVSVDASGNLYICDTFNNVIRVVNQSGSTQTFFGVSIANGNIDTVADFGLSSKLWFSILDLSGRLLVNNIPAGVAEVQCVNTDGSISIVAGTGTPGYSGDGGAATSADIGEAFGLAFAASVPPPANIIIQKVTSPPGDPTGFTIRPSWKPLITLADGQSDTSTPSPGTYSVTEDHVPGWSTVVSVSSGDPPNAIVLASSDITVTFTNSLAAPTTNTAFIDPWVVSIDPLKLTVSDLDGSTDLANLVFNVQDRGQAITSDFPTFVFEGKPTMLLEGYVGMNVSDYLVRFTGLMNTVASDNGNNEYKFSVANYNLKKLTTKVYGLGDDGFTTSDNHPRTVLGHPLDILISVLNQCGVLNTDINLAKIHYYRDFIYNGREFLFKLTSAPTAKDFIESELMRPLGMYVWENNLGQVSINSFYPSIFPFGGYTPVLPPVATLDLTNTIEVPLAQEADLVNQVIFKFDANQGGNSDFAAENITDYDVSITKYGLVDGHTVESQGLRSAFQGYLMSNLIAFLIFLRYGLKNLFVDPVPCFWTLSTLEPGDIIAFNEPFVPDRMLGLLGITGQTFEVMDRTWNFMTGVVELKLLAIDLSKFKQYLITPNGEGSFTGVSAADAALYMFQPNAAGVYSDGGAGNTLG